MALNANALTLLATAKDHLDIPDTSQDTRIEMLINTASQWFERYCGRVFKSASYVHQFDGTSQTDMILREFPVTSITEVRVDWSREFADSTILDAADYNANDDELLAAGILRRHNGLWPRGSRNVKVTYEAGYAEVPSDLEYACLLMVEWLYRGNSDRRIGRTSVGKAGETTGYTDSIPVEIMMTADNYKRTDVFGGRISMGL
jgi:uncharacterized phiE125 gp8 family phage protein